MEKRDYKKIRDLRTIVVTGPESTGKTVISEYLAKQLKCNWVPEYAREYIRGINRKYNYNDLVHIAWTQVEQKIEMEKPGDGFLILDTWLIITKVWFQEVYNKYPEWLDREINRHTINLFLVCRPDIPWIPDPLRENGGERRSFLMNRYLDEIREINANFVFIEGTSESRYLNALNAVRSFFKLNYE